MEYKQPESLFECASHMVGFIIAKPTLDIIEKCRQTGHISVEERRDLELFITRTAEYFDTLIPKLLHNIATQQSLQYMASKFKWKFIGIKYKLNFLDIVLRSHTTNFDFNEWPHVMYNALYRSLYRLKNLQNLKLNGCLSDENSMYVKRAIKNMRQLESFKFRVSCDDDVMKVVCDNCPLKKLDVCNCFTDLSVPFILKLKCLVQLKIWCTTITEKSCVQILFGLPNLKVVYCQHFNSYLEQINSDIIKLPIEAIKCILSTQQDITNLTKYCPLITKLYLVIGSEINDMSGLAVLKHLKILSVVSFPLPCAKIMHLLELNGDQLIELYLNLYDISERTVNEIKHFCPNTRRLILNLQEY